MLLLQKPDAKAHMRSIIKDTIAKDTISDGSRKQSDDLGISCVHQ
jgi:hypothetical protein